MGIDMFTSVLLAATDKVAELAEAARIKGAAGAPAGEKGGERPLFQKLLDSLKDSKAEESEEKKAAKVVHLLKNQPPLPSKVVERIREGSFVDFAFFPVFDDGPGEAGDWKLSSSEASESSSGGFGKRKNPKEVPDLTGWSTCFTLFQVAWASSKPEMWVPLAAYREVIFKLAKRHQWAQVARYDRRFRQEAAGKDDVKWEEENLSLLLDVVHSMPQVKAEPRQGAGGSGFPLRKLEQRRRGACFCFNRGEGRCNFGTQCRFSHVCSNCGGERIRRSSATGQEKESRQSS